MTIDVIAMACAETRARLRARPDRRRGQRTLLRHPELITQHARREKAACLGAIYRAHNIISPGGLGVDKAGSQPRRKLVGTCTRDGEAVPLLGLLR